jgi:hypothetical protein
VPRQLGADYARPGMPPDTRKADAFGEGDAGAQIVPLRAMICGLARLVEGLQCFSDEFGISRRRVLVGLWEHFQGRDAEAVLAEWLHGGEWGASCIQQLFHDFAAHQMALVKGLEGVAHSTACHFDPQNVEQQAPRLMGLRPALWSRYRRYYHDFLNNQLRVHQALVMPGFIQEYIRARERQSDSWVATKSFTHQPRGDAK